jgi:hypothetical protein
MPVTNAAFLFASILLPGSKKIPRSPTDGALVGVARSADNVSALVKDLPVAAPESTDLQGLVEQIAARIGRALERSGLVERDLENAWLATDTQAGPLDDLLGHSITYRIAVGPRAGQKLFTLQTVPPRLQGLDGKPNGAARAGGFSLHAGVDIAPNQREKLERLCRYVSRTPVASERLALTASGQVRYTLKAQTFRVA